MQCVLDSSVALAWALPDESSPAADRLLASLPKGSVFWVPALWWYEVTNALVAARRRRRLAEADRARIVEIFGMLPVRTDGLLDAHLVWRLFALADAHAISAYDAAYLELAQRRGLGLATLDRRLITASAKVGVPVLTAGRSYPPASG